MAFATSKSFTEFYVTQGVSANDLNAGGPNLGADDGPVATYANCDVAAGAPLRWDIDNNNGGAGWGATQVGDYVRIDTAGTKELGVVYTLSMGGDDDVIEVGSALVGGITAPVNGKNCNVGGAFATLNAMTDLLEATSNRDAIGPVRTNIKRHGGTPYVQACDIDTNAGTSIRPITIEAYNTTPGDIDPLTSTDRAKFEPDAAAFAASGSTGVIDLNQPFYRLLNLDCETAEAGKYGLYLMPDGDFAVLANCRGKAPAYGYRDAVGCYDGLIYRCVFEECGTAGMWIDSVYYNRYVRNIVRGTTAGPGIKLEALRAMLFLENLIYGNSGAGIDAHDDQCARTSFIGNLIADNGGDGIDLGAETDLETNVITNNIIAHNGGWGIATDLAPAGGGGYRFALLDYNMIYDNTAGAVEDIEAGGALSDDSEHDDEANAPFTGANAGARAANFYELTSAAKGVRQYFADTDFDTWPDMGAAQVEPTAGGAVGRGFMRGTA